MKWLSWLLAGILASSCISPPQFPQRGELVLLERPERPVLSSAEEIGAAVAARDVVALMKLYGRDMAELMGYARMLEAQLDAAERQLKER